jgi:hypothetical protein
VSRRALRPCVGLTCNNRAIAGSVTSVIAVNSGRRDRQESRARCNDARTVPGPGRAPTRRWCGRRHPVRASVLWVEDGRTCKLATRESVARTARLLQGLTQRCSSRRASVSPRLACGHSRALKVRKPTSQASHTDVRGRINASSRPGRAWRCAHPRRAVRYDEGGAVIAAAARGFAPRPSSGSVPSFRSALARSRRTQAASC